MCRRVLGFWILGLRVWGVCLFGLGCCGCWLGFFVSFGLWFVFMLSFVAFLLVWGFGCRFLFGVQGFLACRFLGFLGLRF